MEGQEWALPVSFAGVDFTYSRPPLDLSFLSNTHITKFCSSGEGWGPVSPTRDFDFTPCFEQGALIPAGLLSFIVFAAPRVFQLIKASHDVDPSEYLRGKKSLLLLYSKIVLLLSVTVVSVANLIFVVLRGEDILRDPSLYTAILEVLVFPMTPVLTYFNHNYTRRSSTILLTFYPYHISSVAISLRTQFALISSGERVPTQAAHLAISVAGLLLLIVAWMLECFGPETDETLGNGFVRISRSVKETPYLTANAYSRLAFNWMTPLMRLGSERYIVQDDLNNLLPEDSSGYLGERLQHYWEKEMQRKGGPSLWRALAYSYGGPFALAAILKIFTDLLAFAQPQFLHMLLSFILEYQRGKENTSGIRGFAISLLMFVAAIAQSAILHQYFQLCFLTGSRIRAGLVMATYRKSLVLSNDEKTVRGDIVNLMSVDASRLQDLCTYALMLISGPFQITLAFISLYKLLGWPAFVGVAVMILAIPINTGIARFLKKLQEAQMKNRDGRTRMMSELLNNIKRYGITILMSRHKILAIRNERELKMLRKIGFTNALNSVFWSSIPLLVALASFATAAYTSDTPLTSEVIFPSLSLFMLLQFPLGMFAMITSSIISAIVSVSRLSKFLQSAELQPDARTYVLPRPSDSAAGSDAETSSGISPCPLSRDDTVLSIRNGEFRWARDSIQSILEDINLDVKMGELIGVYGRVGAGKSSLLSAIIGEMVRSEGAVELFGTVAYAPQNPWIMSSTVRENITFSRHFDAEFYEMVLDACALRPDLAVLADGDMTEVGEKGITLSGGQRARISLARCVYARADLYLLDDVLAAVDSHVAKHLFDHVIGPKGMLSQKARIVVTNSVSFVREYDEILLLRRGIILESGCYKNIKKKPNSQLCKLITEYSSDSGPGSNSSSGNITPTTNDDSTLAASITSSGSTHSPIPSLYDNLRAPFEGRPSILSRKEHQDLYEQKLSQQSKVILTEMSQQGRVKADIYFKYLKAASRLGVFFFVFCMLLQNAFTILSNLVLRSWGENNLSAGGTADNSYYIAWFGIDILMATLASLLAGICLWVYCAVRSAQQLHDAMLYSILRAPLGWFERTPQGRILNLFSKDVNVIDELLPRMFSGFFRTMVSVLGILVVMAYGLPVSLIAVIPIAFIYQHIMTYYLATSRELKRLDAVSRSPIFAWFQESLGGLSTIRAFQIEPVFLHVNEMRSDTNLKAYLPSTFVNRSGSRDDCYRFRANVLRESGGWPFLGSCIVLVVAVLSVWTLLFSGKIDSGLVGLILSYAVGTTGSLNWVIRSASDVEQNIVSVERVLNYVEVEPEAPAEIPEMKPSGDWPHGGAIRLENFCMRYRPELDLILQDITLDVSPGERLGICGRTGAGKSSLILGLLRINEADSGRILIDGTDISTIGLHDLRSAISIIPQEPQLFAGTIRQNVDVTEMNTDEEIWHALDQVHLKQTVSSLGGLDAQVREGGSSMSAGQRQLICFARALIRHTRQVLPNIGEATSAIDLESDQAIQDVLRGSQFDGVTRLTIAHRLHTIIESDRILVLDAGKVAELDTPQALLANELSIFASLASEAGIQ
ncbi:hypothetical protein BS47DRAFT_1388932 [Hydnum rufescens UP504]|uniref:Uncharacterized protein n=1 Tax=Hydnum rufescens UP504 TaxID=1448309 RepID=A0A9P6B6P7_9AGAM|nr:hypothetical protein BS47DRAFT_1388932 [Hydnum rufescens UP504]